MKIIVLTLLIFTAQSTVHSEHEEGGRRANLGLDLNKGTLLS